MNFAKIVAVIFSITVFFGLSTSGFAMDTVSGELSVSALAELELSLEMAHKDYHLELGKPAPDQVRLAELQESISALTTKIERMSSMVSGKSFGIVAEVFEMEIAAAVASEDYGRISELLHNLRLKGDEAVQAEAMSLVNLSKQLRFIAVNSDGGCSELRAALGQLDIVMDCLQA